MSAPLSSPPGTLCILRLSAIGDTCNLLAVVRTLQRVWPRTQITWIIGRVEAKLLGHIPDIEFIVVDKSSTLRAYRGLKQALRGRKFDVLLHMQLAMRASILSTLVKARIKVGFDRSRARELQWLFTTHRIRPAERQHVLDGFFGFCEYLGVYERELRWDIPIPAEAEKHARKLIADSDIALVISPCSSHPSRNWRAEYYAQVADHASETYGMKVILCGGRSDIEQRMGADIAAQMRHPCVNMIGQDTLLELLATLKRAAMLVTPDSGPAHMATAVGTPVVGLYAATNPARSGPYLSRQWCVDKYEVAAKKLLGKDAAQIPWTTKIERPGVMDLITPDEVNKKIHTVMRARQKRRRS